MATKWLLSALALLPWAEPVYCEVLTSEFVSAPEFEGWTLSNQWGEVTTWIAAGVYYQDFPNDCPAGPVCASQSFTRSIDSFNGQPHWFYEYRLSATGDSTEIPAGAPTVLAAFNAAGNLYHCTVASDKLKLSGGPNLPILFLDVGLGPHRIRLELFNEPPPATFHWYVDSVLVLEGLAKSPFPDFDSRITWQGRTWMQPTLNAWYYIRAGDIPVPASGDFDSNGAADSFELFYFAECLDRSESGEPANPSCSWADMNADNTVDCTDAVLFAAIYTGDPADALFAQCPSPIPAVSDWGAAVLTLLTLTAGTVAFRRTARVLVRPSE